MNEKRENWQISDLKARNNAIGELKNLSSDRKFCTYTSLESAVRILTPDDSNNCYFYLNSIRRMNDPKETALHEECADSVYALCFCHSKSESIPLWFLYGGITGDGVRIEFTPSKMRAFIESISEVYPVVDNKPQLNSPLKPKKDYEMQFGWVYYCRENDDDTEIRFWGQTYPLEGDYKVFRKDNYFIKDYPWNYEKEFRILFRLKRGKPERIAVCFDKEGFVRGNGLNIMLGPNISFVDNENSSEDKETAIAHLIAEKAVIFKLRTDRIKTSKLGVKLDLLNRNRFNILEHFPDLLDEFKKDSRNGKSQDQRKEFCAALSSSGICSQS